jgi:pimeloyl-ACP methyl ester carboxylesterase
MARPEMLDRLAILNVPHPVAMQHALRNPAQLKKSSYIFLLQIPLLPERAIARADFALLRMMWTADGMKRDAIERYVVAARASGLEGPINYYRALMRSLVFRTRAAMRRIDVPVLVLWGQRDRYIGEELSEPSAKWVPNVRVEKHAEASHWIQDDAPEWVSAQLCAFAREGAR